MGRIVLGASRDRSRPADWQRVSASRRRHHVRAVWRRGRWAPSRVQAVFPRQRPGSHAVRPRRSAPHQGDSRARGLSEPDWRAGLGAHLRTADDEDRASQGVAVHLRNRTGAPRRLLSVPSTSSPSRTTRRDGAATRARNTAGRTSTRTRASSSGATALPSSRFRSGCR